MLKPLLFDWFDLLSRPRPMWTDGEFHYVIAPYRTWVDMPDVLILYPAVQNSWGWWTVDDGVWVTATVGSFARDFQEVDREGT